MIETTLERAGLRLFPKDRRAALLATLSGVVGVTLFVLVLDGLLFRRSLPESYEALFTPPCCRACCFPRPDR